MAAAGSPSTKTGFSPGPKGRNYFLARNAALKSRSSTTINIPESLKLTTQFIDLGQPIF